MVIKINYQEIRKAVTMLNSEDVEEHIEKITKGLKNSNLTFEEIQNYYLNIIMLFKNIAEEFNLDFKDRYFDILGIVSKVNGISTIDDLKALTINEAKMLIKDMENSNRLYSPVISRVLEYIDENLSENLSLRMLGDKFHINPNYLGYLFNNEVGEQFSTYINRCRIEKSRKLLLNTSMKVNTIAKHLGYSNPSYFYRKFKEYHGVSPNEFRDRKVC